MPRPARLQNAGYVHHVITRGNDRQPLFIDPEDFRTYLTLMDSARRDFPLQVYNYVLMSNHVHLLVEPLEDGSLSKVMHYVTKEYAKYFNKKYNRTGHVFEGRFKSFVVQTERYFFACSRYIDLNPVRAKLVDIPQNYLWSGFQTLGAGESGSFRLDVHGLYTQLGPTPFERQIAYRALVLNSQSDDLDLLHMRASVLGDREFKKSLKVAA